MPWSLLADGMLVIHALFVVFVVAGGLVVLRRPVVAWAHLPCAAWGAWIEFSGTVCPLTPLENTLRGRAGKAGYTGGFLDHWVSSLLYPPGLTREMQIFLGAAVLVVNAAVYLRLYARMTRERGS